jgi:hypothetical protein
VGQVQQCRTGELIDCQDLMRDRTDRELFSDRSAWRLTLSLCSGTNKMNSSRPSRSITGHSSPRVRCIRRRSGVLYPICTINASLHSSPARRVRSFFKVASTWRGGDLNPPSLGMLQMATLCWKSQYCPVLIETNLTAWYL